MTTPNQPQPDGAYVIGGGADKFGSKTTEDSAKELFTFPAADENNKLELLRWALDKIPHESLKPWQGWLGLFDDSFNDDPSGHIINSLGTHPLQTIKDRVQKVVDNIQNAVNGDNSTGNPDSSVKSNIQNLVNNLQTTTTTLQSIAGAGNLVISPNFELTTIQRPLLGTPTAGYTTEQAALSSRSFKWNNTAATYNGVYLAPSQTNIYYDVQPGDSYTAGVKLKAHASNNTTAGTVGIAMRCFSNGVFVSDLPGGTSYTNATLGTGWQTFSISGIIPAGVDTIAVFICSDNLTPIGNSYYIDAAYVREQTAPQKIVDLLHQAVNGGTTTGNAPGTVLSNLRLSWAKMWEGLTGFSGTDKTPDDVKAATGTVRQTANNGVTNAGLASGAASTAQQGVDKTKSMLSTTVSKGNNIATDPGFENTYFYHAPSAGGSITTEQAHTGTRSLKLVGEGAGTYTAGYLIVDETGVVYTPCSPGDVYYVEYWVYGKATNNTTGGWFPFIQFNIDLTNSTQYYANVSASRSNSATWIKYSGYITIPANAYRFFPAAYVGPSTPATEVYYIDDIVIREVTEGNVAKTNVQTVTDAVVQAVDNSSTTGNAHTTVKQKLQLAWANMFDGLSGNTGSSARSLAEVQSAANTVRQVANNGVTNAGLASTAASTADGKAVTAADLSNAQAARGSNIASNPGFESYALGWSANAGVTRSTELARTGSYSCKIVSDGSSQQVVNLTVDQNGVTTNKAAVGDTYYAEFWVYGKSTNSATTAGTIHLRLVGYNVSGGYTEFPYVGITAGPTLKNGWTKVSGYITLTVAGVAYMSAQLGIITGPGNVPTGDTYYFDDVILREVTEGNTAKVNAQTITDSVVQAVDGGTATGAAPATVKSKLQLAWANMFDGLSGNTGSTSRALSEVQSAANTVRQVANNGVTNAGLASSAASTADGKAVTADNKAVAVRQWTDSFASGGSGNMCTNPGFEDTTQALWNNTITQYSNGNHMGSKSLRIAATTGNDAYAPLCSSTSGEILQKGRPNQSYYIEFWAFGDNSNTATGAAIAVAVGVWMYDKDMTYIDAGLVWGTPNSIGKNQWVKISGKVTIAGNSSVTIARPLVHMGQGMNGNIYYIDDVVVREITEAQLADTNAGAAAQAASTAASAALAANNAASTADGKGQTAQNQVQTTVDNIHQAINGGTSTGNSLASVKTNLTTTWNTAFGADGKATKGLAVGLSLGKKGSNLCTDPGFENTSLFWDSNGPTRDTAFTRHGTYAAKFTANGTYLQVGLTPDTVGRNYVNASVGDTYYTEMWIRGGASNVGTAVGALYMQLVGYDNTFAQVDSPVSVSITNSTTYKNTWTKVSGYASFTNANIAYMLPLVGMTNDLAVGDVFYVDQVVVREVTEGNVAKTNVQTTVDNIHQAVNGGVGVGNPLSTVKSNLQTTWNTAIGAQGNLQTTIDNIHQAVNGGSSTGNSVASVKTNLQTAWSSLFDGLNGTSGSTGKTPTDVQTAATTVRSNHTSLVDNIYNAVTGLSTSGQPIANAFTALQQHYLTTGNHTTRINALEAKKNASAAKGALFAEDFGSYADGALPAGSWTVTHTGSGTATIGVVNGQATWTNTNNADRDAKIIYNTATNTDFQILRGTMSTAPDFPINGGTPKFYAIGRVGTTTTTNDTYVWARAYQASPGAFRADIGCTVAGVETVWQSNITLKWSLDMSFVVGVGANQRQYQVWSGGSMVWQHTETGSTSVSGKTSTSPITSSYGASFRKWGSVSQLRAGFTPNGPRSSGGLAACSVADNALPTINGTYAQLVKTDAGTMTLANGDTILTSFWSGNPYCSLDITASTTNGTFRVSASMPYSISARVKLANGSGVAKGQIILQTSPDGSTWTNTQFGNTVPAETNQAFCGSWLQYLNAGDYVRVIARYGTTGILNCLAGATAETYFTIHGSAD